MISIPELIAKQKQLRKQADELIVGGIVVDPQVYQELVSEIQSLETEINQRIEVKNDNT